MRYLGWPGDHSEAPRSCHMTYTRQRNSAMRRSALLCPASCHTLQHLLTRRPSATAGNCLRNLCAPTSKRAKGNLSTYTEQRIPALVGSHIVSAVETTPHKRENMQSVRWHWGEGESNTERAKWLESLVGIVRTR